MRLLELSGNLLFRRGAQYVAARLREEDGVARAREVLRDVLGQEPASVR